MIGLLTQTPSNSFIYPTKVKPLTIVAKKLITIKMAYSLDFIAHVLRKKKEDNLSLRVAAKRFDVAVCTIQKWEKGDVPKNKRNRLPLKICPQKLRQDVIDYPDAYQRERATRFGVTSRAIGYALKRLKITRKKRLLSTQRRMKQNEKNTD